MRKRFIGWLVVSACMAPVAALGQDVAAGDSNRMLRALSWTETRMDGMNGTADGFYPEFGGLITGSGIGAGPGYRRHLLGDNMMVDVSGAFSIHGYTQLQSTVAWPRLMDGRLAIGGQARYNDFTQINYYGIGRASARSDQTDYRLKYVDTAAFATLSLGRVWSISGRAGVMQGVNLGNGTSTAVPSILQRFDDASAPGLAAQPNYLHADIAVEADTRDIPGYPSAGGRYRVSVASFHDRDFGRYSFNALQAEASQYIPVGNRFVAAIRGRVDLTETSDGQQVPFYMLPALGSGQTLRGYDDYRFRDRDAAMVNAEWRSRVTRLVDAAVFYDIGSVAPSARALTAHQAITDYGVGVRLHSSRHALLRLDVARGTEGLQTIVSVSPSLAFSKRTLAPFVP